MLKQTFRVRLLLAGLLFRLAASYQGPIVNGWETVNRLEGVDENLYQGDIMLTPEQRDFLAERKGLNFNNFPAYKWPDVNGRPLVPYIFDSSLSSNAIDAINSGLNSWMEHTCIVFEQTTNSNQPHLLFTQLSGCWSYIGRISTTSGQNVSIGQGCESLGVVVHEVGHAMGFYHEQSRDDRDAYVVVNLANIISGKEHNFDKASSSELNNFSVPYDFTSVMHYGSTYFTSNGKLTLVTKDPLNQALIGKRSGLSHRDRKLANLMYNCTGKWLVSCGYTADPCMNGGYLAPNCTCICLPGTTGALCETVQMRYEAFVQPDCNQVITTAGTVSNPGYPAQYSYGLACSYLFKARKGCRVKLKFLAFDLYPPQSYCVYDILEIRLNGPTSGQVYCGSEIAVNQTFTSVGRQAVLYFKTNAYGDGWKVKATFVC